MIMEKIFTEIIKEKSSQFFNLEKRIIPDNLHYKYKTEGTSLKDSGVYQNPIDLFKNVTIIWVGFLGVCFA